MIDRPDINSVLMQMRALQTQAQGGAGIAVPQPIQPELRSDRTGFGDLVIFRRRLHQLTGRNARSAVSS